MSESSAIAIHENIFRPFESRARNTNEVVEARKASVAVPNITRKFGEETSTSKIPTANDKKPDAIRPDVFI